MKKQSLLQMNIFKKVVISLQITKDVNSAFQALAFLCCRSNYLGYRLEHKAAQRKPSNGRTRNFYVHFPSSLLFFSLTLLFSQKWKLQFFSLAFTSFCVVVSVGAINNSPCSKVKFNDAETNFLLQEISTEIKKPRKKCSTKCKGLPRLPPPSRWVRQKRKRKTKFINGD